MAAVGAASGAPQALANRRASRIQIAWKALGFWFITHLGLQEWARCHRPTCGQVGNLSLALAWLFTASCGTSASSVEMPPS